MQILRKSSESLSRRTGEGGGIGGGGGGGGAKVIMFINHHACFLNKKIHFVIS